MRNWAIGFIVGSFLCLAGIFVAVGIMSMPEPPPQVAELTEKVTLAQPADATAEDVTGEAPEAEVEVESEVEVEVIETDQDSLAGVEDTEVATPETETVQAEPESAEAPETEEVKDEFVEDTLPARPEPVDVAEIDTEPTEDAENSAVAEEVVSEADSIEEDVAPAEPAQPETVVDAPEVITEETEVAATEPTVIRPQPSTLGIGQGGNSSRLPTISQPEAEETAARPETGETSADPETALDASLPKLGFVLVSDEETAFPDALLDQVGFPAAVALSPAAENLEAAQTLVRAKGGELFVLSPRSVDLSLSGNLTDSQITTLLERYFALMPTAVGFLDRSEATLQKDRALASVLLEYFAANNYELVTYEQGLNSILRLSEAAGADTSLVFRSLEQGMDDRAIQRLLDRASLEASQNGTALVAVPATPDMVARVTAWLTTDRARTVQVSPIGQLN